jgi:hypothetical protein
MGITQDARPAMPKNKKILLAAAVAAAMLPLAGCGSYSEAHNYNAPAPSANVTPAWTRIETPYHYNGIIRACVGVDGVYEDLANDNSVTVVPSDPACAKP